MNGHPLLSETDAWSKYFILFLVTLMMTLNTNNSRADTIETLKDAREAYIDDYRISGRLDPAKAADIETRLKALEKSTQSRLRARTLFELATVQRITNQFETAIGTYERAVAAARDSKDGETEFDAWIGIARSHAYGTSNHGAAEAAFDHAAACAGDQPTRKQGYDMAGYASQLQAGRGELESALLNGLDAIKLAQDDRQRFYALLDTGDVLQKFAESCDYRKLVDARSNDEDDPWGACKRAVASAKSYYEHAGSTARKLGWKFLEQQAQDMVKALDVRLFLINEKATSDQLGQTGVFSAQHAADVVVNENFSSGGSDLPAGLPFAALLEQVMAGARPSDPRSLYLRGVKADLDGNTGQALDYYRKAVALLAVERASLFDLRQSGTVVENRPELIRDLGVRLLKLRLFDEAFVVFESLRSQGLQWLAAAFERNSFTDDERKWIADLVQLDSSISARQNMLVKTTIAGMEHSQSGKLMDELNGLIRQRAARQRDKKSASVLERLKATESKTTTLEQLREAVGKTGIPVVLYWVTPTNVIVWVVSPAGTEVKTVFLPEPAVVDKVSEVRNSSLSGDQPFDEKSAKELHAYLVKPFARFLDRKQAVIVPQGALVGLPFEVLIDAEDGTFLAQKTAVSYAPNAAFAIRALKGRLPQDSRITAIYDEELEKNTHEIRQMKDVKGVVLAAHPSKGMNAEKAIRVLGGAGMVHVLLHGKYNSDDSLQSTIAIGGSGPRAGYVTAAQLLSADWRDTRLAVFSSCEGAVVKTRISNEQFGISWALLAGGVDHVVLSRWRVNAASNAAWMETFYRSLVADKMSPAIAANAAMRGMIESGARHPFSWAGPQVFGR